MTLMHSTFHKWHEQEMKEHTGYERKMHNYNYAGFTDFRLNTHIDSRFAVVVVVVASL